MKQILGRMRRAIQDFNMIQDNDKIAVGLSGGKDSMLLLYALKQYQRFSPEKFELSAITINLGFDNYNPEELIKYCKDIDVPYNIVDTQIGKIIFEARKEKNPCSLCANMRKGALNNAAKAMGYNKVAYAHHSDDVVETFLMSLFFEGRINTFSPVVHLDKKDIYLIRPFVYVEEIDIYGEIKKLKLPIVKNPCPANGNTNRQYFKNFIKNMRHDIPDIKENIMGAIRNTNQINLWDKEKLREICSKNKTN
ncbi:MAG: tRNA 2-thiocytidine biosynthesis TtcA family protein [Caloramator sp.]|nr:tRNA 2-thiocytidine biosynthesis TtcA family protein [Caloramator sp.]